MTSRRRNATESSETRAQLLDTAEQIMREEGYPAVTTRRVATRMGVSNQLVHYYFRTMDDLFLSLMRRNTERNTAELIEAIASRDPLHAMMKLHNDATAAALQVEYLAFINHRKDLSAEAARHSEHLRAMEAEALARVLSESGVDSRHYPSTGIAMILSAIGRIMALEKTVGIELGHTDAKAIVERLIEFLGKHRGAEPRGKSPKKRAAAKRR